MKRMLKLIPRNFFLRRCGKSTTSNTDKKSLGNWVSILHSEMSFRSWKCSWWCSITFISWKEIKRESRMLELSTRNRWTNFWTFSWAREFCLEVKTDLTICKGFSTAHLPTSQKIPLVSGNTSHPEDPRMSISRDFCKFLRTSYMPEMLRSIKIKIRLLRCSLGSTWTH